jgi:AcrR family transcriptional regulator
MARQRSDEKRRSILESAVVAIAAFGLGASTAKIAQGAGVAEGTLFTYFATKEELLNALYLSLKVEVYSHVNLAFPHASSLEKRARHVWESYAAWALANPDKRKVSAQLQVSDIVTPQTRAAVGLEREAVERALHELDRKAALRGLPEGFAAAMMLAIQETAMDFTTRKPRQHKELIGRAFALYWRAVR